MSSHLPRGDLPRDEAFRPRHGATTANLAGINTECKNAPQCAPAKHHFDECVERVHQQESEGGAKEDCVEECTLEPLWTSSLSGPHAWEFVRTSTGDGDAGPIYNP